MGRCGQQVAVRGEVRGEEEDEQNLGELHGFEGERTEVDPQTSAVDGGADVGHQGRHEQGDGGDECEVPIPIEVAHVAHELERERETDGTDEEPQRLVARIGRVPSGDLDVANAVEEYRDRQEKLRRARCVALNGKVHEQRDQDETSEEVVEAGGHLALGPERGEYVERRRDDPRENEKAQFRRPIAR